LDRDATATAKQEIRLDFLIAQLIERDAALRDALESLKDALLTLANVRQVPVTLTGRDVAAMLHVKPGTVANWVSRGKIPFRRANGAVFFVLDELMNWTKPESEK